MAMDGYVNNIESLTKDNSDFRRVLYTTDLSQLVLMSILPNEDIGEEVHDVDQFFRIESGNGKVIINNIEHSISDGSAIVVPKGAKHNIINTGETKLKLYTIYTPPHHMDKTVHKTKLEALSDNEHFDGKTSE